jgi:hypothetical protein
MKNLLLAAVLLLLTAHVAQAGDYEFKAYSWANFGSPFNYVPTTKDDLVSAITGGVFPLGGEGPATLEELFQIGQTSWSDEYDVGGGLHVAFSAAAEFRPAELLPNSAPGIGAKASASNNQYVGASTVIGESYVYQKDTVAVRNPGDLDKLMKSYEVTISLDGDIHVSGDAIAQVGGAILLTFEDGARLVVSGMQTFKQEGIVSTYNFREPGLFTDPPIKLTNRGPYGIELYAHGTNSVTIETLLYVRAQTGVSVDRAAGMASADFSNTMRATNIQFFDENDQVIPGLEVVGSNGDVYPYNVVPEPLTLALFGVGSIGLLFARFRRTQRS